MAIKFACGHTYLRPLQNLAFSSRVSRMKEEAAWEKWEESREMFKPDISQRFQNLGGTEEN